MRQVAVLFARADSIYKTLPGCDVWDIERDARKWPGGAPVVGHPPCRAWGSYRFLPNLQVRPDEKALAMDCVDLIRKWGGVLEHPAGSQLWKEKPLPAPGERDAWGGFTISHPQFHWGHKALKPTKFYICGIDRKNVPPLPFKMGEPTHTQSTMTKEKLKRPGAKPELLKKDREKTPPALAEWLVELARRTRKPAAPVTPLPTVQKGG